MSRTRKPPQRRPTQLPLEFRTWGGARRGAGSKPTGASAGVSHAPRSLHDGRHPVHVTLRISRGLPSLRSQVCLGVVRKAFQAGRIYFGFRLVHYAVQAGHVHLLVEAPERRTLARGVQGLCVRIARRLNQKLGRRGRVFSDRYHARALRTPREVRNALAYVLLQTRRHGAQLHVGISTELDPGTSAGCFEGWTRQPASRAGPWQATVAGAKTWLLRAGWMRHGRIDPREIPGR